MTRYPWRVRAFAAGLCALAGYVDAVGFIRLNGFFVSFMTGNSTRLGVGLVLNPSAAATAAGLVGLFVVGVVVGSLVARSAPARGRAAVLAIVATLLFIAAATAAVGMEPVAIAAMVIAMGAENATFEQEGEARIGLTYVTGTLVKVGQWIAGALQGAPPFAWVPFLLLWIGIVVGGTVGALAYEALGMHALWFAAAWALAASVLVALMNPSDFN